MVRSVVRAAEAKQVVAGGEGGRGRRDGRGAGSRFKGGFVVSSQTGRDVLCLPACACTACCRTGFMRWLLWTSQVH